MKRDTASLSLMSASLVATAMEGYGRLQCLTELSKTVM